MENKHRRMFSKFVLFIFVMIAFVSGVNATTGPIVKSNYRLYYNSTADKIERKEIAEYPIDNAFFYKSASNKSYICYTGINVPSGEGVSCPSVAFNTLSENKKKKLIGLAHIINSITNKQGGIANLEDKDATYYWTQMASLIYLGEDHIKDITFYSAETDKVNANMIDINGKSVSMPALRKAANEYANKYIKDIVLNLSEKELKFNLSGDYYESQKIYLEDKNSNIDSYTITSNNEKFEIFESSDSTGKFLKVKIKKSDTLGKKEEVTVSVSAKNNYYVAKFYDCEDSTIQDLLATETTAKSKTATLSIQGSVSVSSLEINKVDKEGNFISGAKIKVENEDKSYEKIITTENKTIVLDNLPYGKYKITELSAPNQYIKGNDEFIIVLSENKLSDKVTFINNLTTVEIIKIDGKDGSLLKDAELQVVDKEGNVLYEWKTTNEKYVISGLEHGTYYVIEKSAPSGYEKIKNKIEFKVNDTNEIVKVEVKNNQIVKVPDTMSSRSALLAIIAMSCIAIGINTLVFVKNNKLRNE